MQKTRITEIKLFQCFLILFFFDIIDTGTYDSRHKAIYRYLRKLLEKQLQNVIQYL